jgi:hypothetical protein
LVEREFKDPAGYIRKIDPGADRGRVGGRHGIGVAIDGISELDPAREYNRI